MRIRLTGTPRLIGASVVAVALGSSALVGAREVRTHESPASVISPAATVDRTVVPAMGSPATSGSATPTSATRVSTQVWVDRQFGYRLVLPAGWRRSEAERSVASETKLRGRQVFTARNSQEELRLVGSQFLPWDLFVEVWDRDRDDQSAEDWVRHRYNCGPGCAVEPIHLGGVPGVLMVQIPPPAGSSYVIRWGDRLLVLRYGLGTDSDRPSSVSEETLQGIVNSLGVP